MKSRNHFRTQGIALRFGIATIISFLMPDIASAQSCGTYGNPCYIRQSPSDGNLSDAIVNGVRIGEAMRESRRRDEELRIQQEQLEMMRYQQWETRQREAKIRELEEELRAQQNPKKQADSAAAQERRQAAYYWAEVFPVFDPTSRLFSQDLVDEVVVLRDHYESKGESPSKAIERAVRVVTAEHGIQPTKSVSQDTPSTVSTQR